MKLEEYYKLLTDTAMEAEIPRLLITLYLDHELEVVPEGLHSAKVEVSLERQ